MNSINRRELIKRLKALGFSVHIPADVIRLRRGSLKLRVPNPHVGDISIPLLKEILRQAGISEDEWDNAR